jgi:putative transposase
MPATPPQIIDICDIYVHQMEVGIAAKKILSRAEHRQHKGLNNRAENSHQPTRQRERTMRRFKSVGQAQRFLERFGPIWEHFCPGRHRRSGNDHRTSLAMRFAHWREVRGVAA